MTGGLELDVVSASRADDLAYEALEDVGRLSAAVPDVRLVGGQMVQLLLHAFPSTRTTIRRTADADAALQPAVAASGQVDRVLRDLAYEPESGNRYRRGERAIDLLVPSGGRFEQQIHGGRAYDAIPGLMLALAGPAIALTVHIVYFDDRVSACDIQVPGVEAAVVLKALATADRARDSDLVDLANLLEIVADGEWPRFGGWRLQQPPLTGARRDAARALHSLAKRLKPAGHPSVATQRLVALIRGLVADPDQT